tara:strand:- start:248 stop:493 length:246 start_codon:yes stop_codon:yes gene_type:complete
VLDLSHRILYIKLNLTKGKNVMTNLTEAYKYAQSNGVDLNREMAIEELFKTKLGDFMDELNDEDTQIVFELIDKVLEKKGI